MLNLDVVGLLLFARQKGDEMQKDISVQDVQPD